MTVLRTLTARVISICEDTKIIRIEEPLYGTKQDFECVEAESLGDQIEEALGNMDIDLEVRAAMSKVSDIEVHFLFKGKGRIIRSGFSPVIVPSCPYCGSSVELEDENMDYKYQCVPCDINLFEFEAVPDGGISKLQQMSILGEAQKAGTKVDFKEARIDCDDNSRVMLDNGDGLFVSILGNNKKFQSVYIKYDSVCPDKIAAFIEKNEDLEDEELRWVVQQMVVGEHHDSFYPNSYKQSGRFGWEDDLNYVKFGLPPHLPRAQTATLIEALEGYVSSRSEITQATIDKYACSVSLADGRILVGELNGNMWSLRLSYPLTTKIKVKPEQKAKTKTLQKQMTYEEMLEYLQSRPDYRLIETEELYLYIDDAPKEEFFINGYTVFDSSSPKVHPDVPLQRYPHTARIVDGRFLTGHASPIFKLHVFLVKRKDLYV